MYSKKQIRKILNHYVPDDVGYVVASYVPSPLPRNSIATSLHPTGVNLVSSESPAELFHMTEKLLTLMIRGGRIPYLFSNQLTNYMDLMENGYMLNYDLDILKDLIRNTAQAIDQSLDNRLAIFLDQPPRNFLVSSPMQRLLIHATCMRVPVFLVCSSARFLPEPYRQHMLGVISRNRADIKCIGRTTKQRQEMAEDVIGLGEFYMLRHNPPVKCGLGVDGLLTHHIPYQGRISLSETENI